MDVYTYVHIMRPHTLAHIWHMSMHTSLLFSIKKHFSLGNSCEN